MKENLLNLFSRNSSYPPVSFNRLKTRSAACLEQLQMSWTIQYCLYDTIPKDSKHSKLVKAFPIPNLCSHDLYIELLFFFLKPLVPEEFGSKLLKY